MANLLNASLFLFNYSGAEMSRPFYTENKIEAPSFEQVSFCILTINNSL